MIYHFVVSLTSCLSWSTCMAVVLFCCSPLCVAQTNAGPPKLATKRALDPSLPPSANFDLTDWKLDLPVDPQKKPSGICRTVKEAELAAGYQDEFFFTGKDGGMVFRAPAQGAKTSAGCKYTRTELREMLRSGDTKIPTRSKDGRPTKNNWVFSTAPDSARRSAGASDGTLDVTMAVNQVTQTGKSYQVGRVIIGQIHARINEPIRLYYRKLPGNENGSIYAVHETAEGNERTYDLLGSHENRTENPQDGIPLGEKFVYQIAARGNQLRLTLTRVGKPSKTQVIDMSKSGYDVANDYMYFKVGLYHVNDSANPDDEARLTVYSLKNSH